MAFNMIICFSIKYGTNLSNNPNKYCRIEFQKRKLEANLKAKASGIKV